MKPFMLPGLVVALRLLSSAALAQSSEFTESEQLRTSGTLRRQQQEVDPERVAERIVNSTNEFREQHELQAVTTNAELQDTAKYFAEFMAMNEEYGHRADGNRPADRAEEHGYEYCIVLENIAYQYSSRGFTAKELARAFQRGWEQSPGHRKNMLDPDIFETGVAIAQSESGYFYAVQMFGRPKSEQIEFEISNETSEEAMYDLGGKQYRLPPRSTRIHYRCRPAELVVELADDESESLIPKHGDKLTIAEQDGKLSVRR